MLKVECESCKAPYQVDERRVPPAGLKMRCPKCGHTFVVTDPSKGASAAGPGGRPKLPKKATMVGLAPKGVVPGGRSVAPAPAPAPAAAPAAAPPRSAAAPPRPVAPPTPAAPPRPVAPPAPVTPRSGLAAPPAPAAMRPADDDVALPAVKPAAPRSAGLAKGPAAPAVPAPAAPRLPVPGLDEIDLPALAGDVGLPAAVKRPLVQKAPAGKGNPLAGKGNPLAGKGSPPAGKGSPPAPAPAASPLSTQKPFSFDIDLPSVPVAPAPVQADFGALDLPAVAAPPLDLAKDGRFGDLPMPKYGGGMDLPTPKGEGFGDLPMPKYGAGADLPIPKGEGFGDLPVPKGRGLADLPSPKAGDLPVAKPSVTLELDLPIIQGGAAPPPGRGGAPFGELDLPIVQNDLPHLAPPGAHLPSPTRTGAYLPSPVIGSPDLPLAMGPGAHLPSPLGLGPQLPSPIADERLLPSVMSGPAPIAFGELDLPLVDAGGAPFGAPAVPSAPAGIPTSSGFPPTLAGDWGASPQFGPSFGDNGFGSSSAGVGASGFGEVDLPMDNGPSAPPFAPSTPPSVGASGMAFGEVDLGGGEGASAPLGPPPATSAGSFAFQEASLESAPASMARAAVGSDRRAPEAARPSSKTPKILAAALAIIVVGGAALQLTPLGAFGYLWINDKLHAGDNVVDAASKGDAARQKLAVDTFTAAQAAADELFDARKRAPRSRPLGAYAAFVEYANQVRFGVDPARAARVSAFITDVPTDVVVPYLAAAQAAQAAQSGDWEKAKRALDIATAREPKDGIQRDLSILKGEIALAQKDPSALAAFEAAQASGASARAAFGIARAHHQARALDKAKEALAGVLQSTPNHAGALTLRAELTWEVQRDADAAMKDLATVLGDEQSKIGPADLSRALAAKGWILFASDRAGEARAAFDEAVKVDGRNVSALVGQGEMLYSDGRYTEALTRFDEALAKEPASIPAALGSAKTKIGLERLQEAKTQLTQVRQKAPKDMKPALWLARTEEALGDKRAAEELYASAVALADPTDPDAIEAYAAIAKFLASQGKSSAAAAQLEQARVKLPDSAALQRALGDVAVAQGQFQEAIERYETALQRNPNDLGTRFRLGVTYRKMHKLDLAAKALDEVAAIDKEYPALALERGLLFEESGDIQKAIEQFESASQKAPSDVDLMLRVGAAYVAIGDVDKALPLLLKVKDQRPNSAEANHFVGRAYLKQGGLESAAAMRYLQRAVELDPNKAEYHLYVAWAANEATPAQLGLARAHIEKALSLDKLLGDAYWQRGVVERKEGQIVDAIKDLKRALELRPSRHEAHAALAEAYEDKNDMGAALSEWQKAIAGDAKPPLWRWKYGKILSERNQNAEAAKHLVYAVEHGKNAQPRPGWLGLAAFEAGEVLRKTGQKSAACEHYQLYLELAPPTAPDRRDALKAQSDLSCPPAGGQ